MAWTTPYWSERLRPWHIVALAGVVRVALIYWAEYQDNHLPVKYTDIDYVVFTDAARYVASGASPYRRSTYRYSPLLAYMLLPNIWMHPAWGKVLFSSADLLAAGLLSYLLRRAAVPTHLQTIALTAWLFNPYTATISTRGSCDVLSVLLLLTLLVSLLHGKALSSGALYGLAVHFRIYPVIYGPAIALFLARRALALSQAQAAGKHDRQARLRAKESGALGHITEVHVNEDKGGASDAFRSPRTPRTPRLLITADISDPAKILRQRWTPITPTRRPNTSPTAMAAAANVPPTNVRDHATTTNIEASPGILAARVGVGNVASCSAGPSYGSLWSATDRRKHIAAVLPVLLFGFGAASSFVLLGGMSYWMYGQEFLQEAFLHHVTRKDPRHNFSPYYYPVYLSYGTKSGGGESSGDGGGGAFGDDATPSAAIPLPPLTADAAPTSVAAVLAVAGSWLYDSWDTVRRSIPLDEPWRLAALPQAAALLAVAVRFHEDLPAAWLLQTWCFVTLNKVVTAQYFVWYLSLLPLVLPALVAQRAVAHKALLTGGAVWVATQLHWLAWAYQLEMRGRSVHMLLWAAGLLFQAANTALVVLLMRALRRVNYPDTTAADAAAVVAVQAAAPPSFLDVSLMLAGIRSGPSSGLRPEPQPKRRREDES